MPIVGKVSDSIALTHQKEARYKTHVLQFDFTMAKSCLDAAIRVTESVAESKDSDCGIL